MNIADHFEGAGSLEPEGGEAIPVKYSFVVTRTISTKRGLPLQTRADARGVVSALDGASLQEGHYRLVTPDGQRLRVQNLGGVWCVLASPFG